MNSVPPPLPPVPWRLFTALMAIALMIGTALALAGGQQTGFRAVQSVTEHFPDTIWLHGSLFGDTLVALTLAVPVVIARPRLLAPVLLTAIAGGLLVNGIKDGWPTLRPPGALDAGAFTLLVPGYRTGSFPSGHTLTVFLWATLMSAATRSTALRAGALLLACWGGLSRVGCGVHWPVDVCFGAAGGLALGWIGWQLGHRLPTPRGRALRALQTPFLIAPVLLVWHDSHAPGTETAQGLVALASAGVTLRLLLSRFARGGDQPADVASRSTDR